MVFRCGDAYLKFNPEKVINHDHNYRRRAPSCILPDHLNSHQTKGFRLLLPPNWIVCWICSQIYSPPLPTPVLFAAVYKYGRESGKPPYLHPSHFSLPCTWVGGVSISPWCPRPLLRAFPSPIWHSSRFSPLECLHYTTKCFQFPSVELVSLSSPLPLG